MCRLGPDDDFAKVLDFGLVKHFSDRIPGTLPTVEEITAGTPAFMAPEMILSDRHVDGRADIYGLGCVAYYLLTGETVFKGDSAIAAMLAHVKDSPAPPSSRSAFDVAPALDRLILDCLAKDKVSRPRSAEVVAQRLAPFSTTWTETSAHSWWQVHQPDGAAPCCDEPHGSRRCWPRFDREPAVSVF
jgi:serine/threonine-protein kinase